MSGRGAAPRKWKPPPPANTPTLDETDHAVPADKNVECVTKDAVRAAREAKKLAKQLSKKKVPTTTEAVCSLATDVCLVRLEGDKVPECNSTPARVVAPTTPAVVGKSKAQSRAERRAVQEAQRAAKTAAAVALPSPSTPAHTPALPVRTTEEVKVIRKASDKLKPKREEARSISHRVMWFQHLHRERSLYTPINTRELHPAVVRLATQLAARIVVGANARCIALIHALQQVVADYTLPTRTEFARGLETALATSLAVVWRARPPTPSMTNAVKHLRSHLTQLPNNITEFHAKCKIKEAMDTYIREQVQMAGDAISLAVRAKITPGDNILTYGCSSLVEKIVKEAWSGGVKFRVVVVGRRARPDAREMLRRLVAHGVPAVYVDIAAVSFVMRTVDKVVLGAGALLANGWVLSRAGTAQVALVARAHNVPVLVACETHKFSERVQTDAFVYNELGEEETLMESSACPLRAWRSLGTLTPLELTYDVTPPDLVTAVVTELAVLPCTSAPVVLRFKLSEYAL